MKNDPLTGKKCSCKKGLERDNCSKWEGTGKEINFPLINLISDMKRKNGQENLPSI